MLSNAYGIVFTILVINIVYVSFSTIRMILTLKGKRYLAAFVSTFEVVIYILGLSIVLDNLSEVQNIIAYAVGFALGIITGSLIEERLALGYITVNVVSSNPKLNFTKRLREEGFGVTSWTSSGMDGDRISMQILAPRKHELFLYQLVTEIDPKAFIVSYEPKHIQGGFWVKQVRKGKLMQKTMENSEEAEQQNLARHEEENQVVVQHDTEINGAANDEQREESPKTSATDSLPTSTFTKPRPQKPNVKPKL